MKLRTQKWWEKTVEYAYVKKYLGEYEFIWPYDGKHESLSDSAIANGLTWSIIEFKSDLKWENAEKKKFEKHGSGKYLEAKLALMKNYAEGNANKGIAHHFIVYGELDSHNNLSLKSERYFAAENKYIFEPTELVKKGIALTPFIKYVYEFNKWKNGGNNGGSGGGSTHPPQNPDGGLSLSNYGVVVGVGLKNNTVVCMTLEDFVKETTPQKINLDNMAGSLSKVKIKPLVSKQKVPHEEDESFA
ncbi:hypothetical protein [Vibrio splendidus]|uniref:hypothetical protein n=1 Tax=Vibrio splendidus TaxID=29497 RepID=UPI000C836FA0|nr:hypothetical protein [Vibrio splendidus]PMJ93787.1 hypothetical protein BCU10_09750 [Vibrio splendidus]